MKNYIQGKEDECCSVRKQKIIDKEAVSEVLDDDGNVVQPAEAEESHEELQLVKKQFNPMNGQALDDAVESFTISEIDREIARADDEISKLQSEKADWEALKSDLEAL